LACQTNATPETIQFLLNQYRAGAEFRGKHSGSLPLHIAAKNGCDPKVLDLLVEAYPEATNVKCYAGKTPVAYDSSKHLLDTSASSATVAAETVAAETVAH
jgi:hypothetical protein